MHDPSAQESNPGLTRSIVTLRGQAGYVFRSATQASYCFVPADCVVLSGTGHPHVDELRYFRSGWSLRNMRRGSLETGGAFLFPDAGQLVTDHAAADVREFLRRVAAAPHPAEILSADGSRGLFRRQSGDEHLTLR